MIAGNTKPVSFAVADDVILVKAVFPAEHDAEFNSVLPRFAEKAFLLFCVVSNHRATRIRKSLRLADFKPYVRVVAGAAAVPAAMVPRQVLPDLLVQW